MATSVLCDGCGKPYTVGSWPFCPHGQPTFHVDAHDPKFDIGLGEMVSSSRDRAAICRRKNLIEKHPPADTPARQADVKARQMAKREPNWRSA